MLSVCLALLIATMTLGVAIGSVPVSLAQVWHVVIAGIAGHPPNTVAGTIIRQIRLPRVLLTAVVGAALTTAGSVVLVLVREVRCESGTVPQR